jgi:hypothetical protein
MSELAFAEPWPELELAYGLNSADHLVVQSGEIKAWTPDGSGCAWWSRDRRGGWRSREPAGASLRPCLERFCQIDGRFRGAAPRLASDIFALEPSQLAGSPQTLTLVLRTAVNIEVDTAALSF